MDNLKIGIFEKDESETTMKYGYYYKALFSVPFASDKRYVRVWLPEDYDFSGSKRYPVIYFSDGQNLVNKYLTAFGDWHLDIAAHKLYEEKGISFIAVGVDSPRDGDTRENELNPPYVTDRGGIKHPVGDVFTDFLAGQLKDVIDNTFYTLKDKRNTAIGGSSMGGIMAFYGGIRHKDTFGFALCFSPAFMLYSKRMWQHLLDEFNLTTAKDNKFYFFVGGRKFERLFKKRTFMTYDYMVSLGFDQDHIKLSHNPKLIHHEESWFLYLDDALSFWLGGIK